MKMDYSAVFTTYSEDLIYNDEMIINNGLTSFTMGPPDPLELINDSLEPSPELLPMREVSIPREEFTSDPAFPMPSRKSSLDISDFLPPLRESPINNVNLLGNDEVPCFVLPPPKMQREKSLSDLLQEEARRLHAAECKQRRLKRMEILRKRRQQGLLSCGNSVSIRYQQRSDFAAKRVRSSGKFVSEYNYKNAWDVCAKYYFRTNHQLKILYHFVKLGILTPRMLDHDKLCRDDSSSALLLLPSKLAESDLNLSNTCSNCTSCQSDVFHSSSNGFREYSSSVKQPPASMSLCEGNNSRKNAKKPDNGILPQTVCTVPDFDVVEVGHFVQQITL